MSDTEEAPDGTGVGDLPRYWPCRIRNVPRLDTPELD